MNKEVARQALAIVRKATPSEEPDWIKGSVGRPIQIGVPVDRLFVCVWWDGVDPSAAGGVAVRIRLNHEHVTEPSRVKNILGFRVKDRTDPLAANLDDAISPLRRIDHGKSIFHRMGHRFFAIDVLAGRTGIGNHLAMLVVCRRDDDGVDILAVQNFPIIACGWNVLLDSFPGRLVP